MGARASSFSVGTIWKFLRVLPPASRRLQLQPWAAQIGHEQPDGLCAYGHRCIFMFGLAVHFLLTRILATCGLVREGVCVHIVGGAEASTPAFLLGVLLSLCSEVLQGGPTRNLDIANSGFLVVLCRLDRFHPCQW